MNEEDFDDMEPGEPEIEYQLELVHTDDPATLYLVCVSNLPLSPEQYAQALILYAQEILSKSQMTDTNETMN